MRYVGALAPHHLADHDGEVGPARGVQTRRQTAVAIVEAHDVEAGANQPVPSLSRDARALLLGHSFPGNVRELENMMEVGFLFQEGGVVTAEPLERKLRSSTVAPAPEAATAPIE